MWPVQDWKEPTAQELGDAWRDADPYRFAVIQGDFNADGFPDQVRLLFASKAHEAAAFVYLSRPGGQGYERVQLARFSDTIGRSMGVATVKPGRYDTACGKGTINCKAGDPTQITLDREAISLFKTQSSTSYFIWDAKQRRFDQVWITD
ncbi:hypothetical protein BH10PSE17_BH10PSE17_16890 [soil metagenome]